MNSKRERKEHKECAIIERHRRRYHRNWRANHYGARGNMRFLMKIKALKLINN